MKRQIYIETTIPSVYHETRTDTRAVSGPVSGGIRSRLSMNT